MYVCKYTLRFVKEDNGKGRGNEVEHKEKEKRRRAFSSLSVDTLSHGYVLVTRRGILRSTSAHVAGDDEETTTTTKTTPLTSVRRTEGNERKREKESARARSYEIETHRVSTLTLYITLIM